MTTRSVGLGRGGLRIVAMMRGGSLLCAGVTPAGGDGGKRWWLEPSGRRVGPATAQKLIETGVVVSQGDGLLPDAPQSWRLA